MDRVGKATVRFTYEVRGSDGRLCCEGHTELAAVDASKSPVRLPDEILERLGGSSQGPGAAARLI